MVPTKWVQYNFEKEYSVLLYYFGKPNSGTTNSTELPSGIYYCEMMDRENVTHHLYAGIYPEDEGV